MPKKKSKTLSKERKELLLKLEQMIGDNCYNGNIQNFYMWEWSYEGRWFRYPLTFINKDGKKEKCRYPESRMASDKLRTGFYAFGANQLHIIDGLIQVLEYLEENHGLKLEE